MAFSHGKCQAPMTANVTFNNMIGTVLSRLPWVAQPGGFVIVSCISVVKPLAEHLVH